MTNQKLDMRDVRQEPKLNVNSNKIWTIFIELNISFIIDSNKLMK